jgi:hypothetical protein
MGFWRTFRGCFYAPETYAHWRYQRQGYGFVYALKLVALATLIGTLAMGVAFHRYLFAERHGQPPLVDRVVREVAAQLPPFALENGTLKTWQSGPAVVHVTLDALGGPAPLFTVDTSGQTTAETMTTPVLMTAHEFISKSKRGEIRIRQLAELTRNQPNIAADSPEAVRAAGEKLIAGLHRNLPTLYAVAIPLIWFGLTIAFFITRCIMLLALGVVAVVMASPGPRLTYVDGVRMASVSYTPVAVFSALAFAGGFTAVGTGALFALGVLMLLCTIAVTKDMA